MRNLLYAVTIVLLNPLPCFSQDAVQLLRDAKTRCEEVQQGSYQMESLAKYPLESDTIYGVSECEFEKVDSDTLFGFRFRAYYSEDSIKSGYSYTGSEFADFPGNTSEVTVMPVAAMSEEINDFSHNYDFFDPLTRLRYSVLSDIDTSKNTYSLAGTENIHGTECVRIHIVEYVDATTGIISAESEIWINTIDSVPLKYSASYVLVLNGDTLTQYKSSTLLKYKIDSADADLQNLEPFIPKGYKVKEYVSAVQIELLTMGSSAPRWEVKSFSGDKYSSRKLKGKVVLLDFFFQSCYPCIQALPFLEELYSKYSEKGLVIIGIDNAKGDKERFNEFSRRHKINYPVVFDHPSMQETFKVQGFPTFYLIDGSGKILYSGAGFGEALGEQIELMILKELD